MGRRKKTENTELMNLKPDVDIETADFSEEDKEYTKNFIEKSNLSFPKSESIRIMNGYNKGKALFKPAEEILKTVLGKKKISSSDLVNLNVDEETKESLKSVIADYRKGQELMNKAKEEMIQSLDMFIYWVISNNFKTFTRYSKDLYQEGVLGILKGIDIYDPNRTKATTFFYVYILHEMNEFINININKTSAHYSAHIVKVKRAINTFEKENREWTIKDIAQETGISPETILQAVKIIERANEVHYDNLACIEDKLSENFASPEEKYIKNEMRETIIDAIKQLSPEEQQVVILKHGLGDSEPLSYKNIFAKTGIPVDKIKKYYNSALRKLRNNRLMKKSFKNHIREEKVLNEGIVGIIPEDISNSLMEDLQNMQEEMLQAK